MKLEDHLVSYLNQYMRFFKWNSMGKLNLKNTTKEKWRWSWNKSTEMRTSDIPPSSTPTLHKHTYSMLLEHSLNIPDLFQLILSPRYLVQSHSKVWDPKLKLGIPAKATFFFFFLRERVHKQGWGSRGKERERISSRPQTQHRARCRAHSHDPEIMARPKIKN